MGEQEALFCFLDGLCGWAKMELERYGLQDLTSAIAAAKSLIELKREFSKGQGKKTGGSDKGGGDWDKSPKKDKPSKDKWKGNKDEAPKKYSSFLCSVSHQVFECPKRGKLSTLVQGE